MIKINRKHRIVSNGRCNQVTWSNRVIRFASPSILGAVLLVAGLTISLPASAGLFAGVDLSSGLDLPARLDVDQKNGANVPFDFNTSLWGGNPTDARIETQIRHAPTNSGRGPDRGISSSWWPVKATCEADLLSDRVDSDHAWASSQLFLRTSSMQSRPRLMKVKWFSSRNKSASGFGGLTGGSGGGMCSGMWITIGPKAVFREMPSTSAKKLYTSKSSKKYRIATVHKNWLAVVDEQGTIGWMHGSDIYALDLGDAQSGGYAGRQNPDLHVVVRDTMESRRMEMEKAGRGKKSTMVSSRESRKSKRRYRDFSVARSTFADDEGLRIGMDANMGWLIKTQKFTSLDAGITSNYSILNSAPALIIRGAVIKGGGKYDLGAEGEYYKTMFGKLGGAGPAGNETLEWEATGFNIRALIVKQVDAEYLPKFIPELSIAGRAGYRYSAVNFNRLDDTLKLPEERLGGLLLGLNLTVYRLNAHAIWSKLRNHLTLDTGIEFFLFGSLKQTDGMSDGDANINGLKLHLLAHYDWKPNMELMAGYTYIGDTYSFSGNSERNPGLIEATRKDGQHIITTGINYRF